MQSSVTQQNTNNQTAVVIGSSMAGLLSARVLADFFAQVIIIERDSLPQQPEARKGVPQANHVHALLTKGYRILKNLFPGIDVDLKNAGAAKIDWCKEYPVFGHWGWHPSIESDLITYSASRVFLEWLVRHRLADFENIKFRDKTLVLGLLSDSKNNIVKGIKLLNSSQHQEEELIADLVVDASGRNSQLPNWLDSMGYQKPKKTEVNSFLGYSTRWYERPQDLEVDWKGIGVTYKAPHHKHGGLVLPVEGNKWAVILAGIAKDYPPNDDEKFLECARNLRNPAIYNVIKNAKPISKIYTYRRTENCWYHYDKLAHLPEGIVVVGDAVCAFNPIYGQGMTTAALGAITLQKSLKKKFINSQFQPKKFTINFQKQLAKILETPWLMATSDDFRWETTEGGKPSKITRFMHKYMDEIFILSIANSQVCKTLVEVIHMIKQPTALFSPGIIFEVLKQMIRRKINTDSQDNPTSKKVVV